MIGKQLIDQFARSLSDERQHLVSAAASAGTVKREQVLHNDYQDLDALRKLAASIKDHTLHHLGDYLAQAEQALVARGAKVHFAVTGEDACQTILSILQNHGVTRLTKSKSMAAEEIHLNPFLIQNGVECLESDLGEFIIQLDNDVPSHIVKPIIHKNRSDVARTFQREKIAEDFNDDPQTLTRRARVFLREKYMQSQACITGANFVCADSGRLLLVTNEGNSRFGMAPVPVHIALVGIEKLIPREKDLAVFLNLLARSATGQQLTVYTEFINGPRAAHQTEGPEHLHVVFMDNGRSKILASNCREILRCLRCGACQNVCPVYRQASGHAYRSIYGGPIGAVLSPLLFSERFPELADLAKASTLCGACNEVCPVDIPIPDLLLRLRDKAQRQRIHSPAAIPMAPFAALATSPVLWRGAMSLSKAMNHLPIQITPLPPARAWFDQRALPAFHGGDFRKWMKARLKNKNRKPED
jgi:L-lactate dehydrogenase complex protein LldF